MTQNQIQYHNALETERHNKMMEAETNRHQVAQEALQREANELQRAANAINEAHYQRMDAENFRSNLAREGENVRSNVASEYIRNRSNAIQSAQVAETSRHQKAQEQIEKSLNESLIQKNFAQVSEVGANTAYIQARTKTEGWNTNLAIADVTYRNAQTALAGEQTQTEHTKRFANAMYGVNQGVGAVTNVFRTIIPVSGGLGGASTGWTAVEKAFGL